MKKRILFIVSFFILAITRMEAKTDAFQYTNIGNVRLTITNFGMLGNGFTRYIDPATGEPYPSGEYPAGSGIEHVYRAGLWIGAKSSIGTHVTTGAVDATSVTPGSTEGFEFAPSPAPGDTIIEKSSLLISPYYSTDAVSEQDFYATYYDYQYFTGDTLPPNHHPLGLRVKQRSYVWSYSYIDDVVIISYTIINDGIVGDLDSVYIGLYAELATGSREFWGDDFGRTPFFQHKRLFFDSSSVFIYEKNDGYDFLATSMAGFKLLGVVKDTVKLPIDSFTISFNWWGWRGMSGSVSDSIRYVVLSNGEIDPNVDDDYCQTHEYPDPIGMISFGPIIHLNAGDSITVVFAFVGGMDETSLMQNAFWAQKAFDANYVLPAPPPSPRLVGIPQSRKVILYFDNSPEFARDPSPPNLRDFEGYRIYRGLSPQLDDTSWTLLAEFDKTPEDTIQDVDHSGGYNTGMPPIETEGAYSGWYKFIDSGVKNGFTYYYAVTSYDVGNPQLGLPSLESSKGLNLTKVIPGTPATSEGEVGVYPNPYYIKSVWDTPQERVIRFYNLPRNCTIYILNEAGDLVKTIKHESDYGEETWNLLSDKDQPVATGLYIFVVRDEDTGKIKKGKFLIIK